MKTFSLKKKYKKGKISLNHIVKLDVNKLLLVLEIIKKKYYKN